RSRQACRAREVKIAHGGGCAGEVHPEGAGRGSQTPGGERRLPPKANDLRVDIGRRLTDGPRGFSGPGLSDGPVRRRTVQSEWAGGRCVVARKGPTGPGPSFFGTWVVSRPRSRSPTGTRFRVEIRDGASSRLR